MILYSKKMGKRPNYVNEDDYAGPSADELSAVGYFGSDYGDGGDCGDGSAI